MGAKFTGLIEALSDVEMRLNYYATHQIPESLGYLLRSAALEVHTVIEELKSPHPVAKDTDSTNSS